VAKLLRRLRRAVSGPRTRAEYHGRCTVCGQTLRICAEDLTAAETVEFLERASDRVARHCEKRSM
jgi:hypothetical protein